MRSSQDTYTLANGVKMPCIGLGTYQSPDAVASAAVKDAMAAGYRLIDTAAAYGNERGVGQGIRISGVPREEIFVTSKLRNAAHGYQATLEAFDMTLSRLGLRYLDLYLIHWPNPIQYRTTWQEATIGTWKAFEELYKAGRIRAIGVSNFMPHHIELLKAHCEILPMVNQLRLCPGVTQPEVVARNDGKDRRAGREARSAGDLRRRLQHTALRRRRSALYCRVPGHERAYGHRQQLFKVLCHDWLAHRLCRGPGGDR